MHSKIDYQSIISALMVPTFVIDQNHVVIAWNRACEELTGTLAVDIVGQKRAWYGLYQEPRPCLADIVLDGELDYMDDLYIAHSKAKYNNGFRAENWHDNINGKRRYLIIDAAPIYDEQGELVAAMESLEDATEARAIENRLMLSDKVFTYTKQAIMITDEKFRIIQCNEAFETLTGFRLDEVRGQSTEVLQSDKHDAHFYEEMEQALTDTGYWEGEIWDKRKDGETYAKWMTVNQVRDPKTNKVSFYISIFYDITERVQTQNEIRHIAFHDNLTGLPNRLLFEDRLETSIKMAKRNSLMLAVLFIDLDGFKAVNDTYGHQAGDELLIDVADRLKSNIREVDTVARLGGDEFVVILTDINMRQNVTHVTRKLMESLNEPYLGLETPTVTPSIGIALFPEDGMDMETLIESADKAMYSVKSKNKNGYQFFTEL
jgi:diguanylate cyclase (GGDEF)-like protein/PAS domain S-box-containing protein